MLTYHENNLLYPFLPQEDSFFTKDAVYTVADGITHEFIGATIYPIPSDAFTVAEIVTHTISEYLSALPIVHDDDIKTAFIKANTAAKAYNQDRELWRKREENVYSFGACVAATAVIQNNQLIYGVLDDCNVTVFNKEGERKLTLRAYVLESTAYLQQNYDWNQTDTRKLWRKEIRNKQFATKEGTTIGYGAIDGTEGFLPYLQTGWLPLEAGDLVCIYSDGFETPLVSPELIQMLLHNDFTMPLYKKINTFLRSQYSTKEKSAYFLRFNPKKT